MTLTGYFVLNAGRDRATSENKCVKLIKIDTYCRRCKSPAGTLVCGNIRFMRIFGRILQTEDVKGQCGRALTLFLNTFSWLSNTIA